MRPAFGFGRQRASSRREQVADGMWSLRLSSNPAASRTARSWLRDTLAGVAGRGGGGLGTSVVSDAVLCISELVNASLRAGSTMMLLEVHRDEHSLRLSVLDDGTTPDPRQTGGSAEHWGMLLIGAAAQCMGIEPHGYGRELWARLSVDQRRGLP